MEESKHNNAKPAKKPMGFALKLALNLVLMGVVFALLVYAALCWLDAWTLHGQYKTVPDVKGRPYDSALQLLELEGFVVELSDSIYDRNSSPGTVVEQNPKENNKVKPGRTVYLTINAFSPKNVTLPSLTDISVRQARSILEGLGITKIETISVPSEFKDLVIGARHDGVELQAGARVPVTSSITLEVGDGLPEITDSLTASDPSAEALDLF